MTLLGDGLFGPSAAVAVDPDEPADDLMALRLESVLTALEGLRESLTELPTPQVFIDAPDLSAIVTAVNGLKPGADADQIAEAVVRTLAPTSTPAETSDWQGKLVDALEKLDFRLKGIAGQGTSNANLPALLTSAPASDTGQAALPVRIISQLGAGTGGGSSATSVTINDPTVTSQKLAIDASGRVTVVQSGPVAVTGTFFQTTQPVSAASLPLPTGAATSAAQTDGTQKTQVTNFPATQAVSLATNTPDVTDRAARLLGHVTVDNATLTTADSRLPSALNADGGLPTHVQNFPVTQAVSMATNTPDVTDRAARLLGHVTVDNASLTVSQRALASGTDSVTVVQSGTVTTDVSDRAGRLLGHVTIDNASLTVSNGQTQPLTDTQLRASAVPVSLASNTPVIATGTNSIGTVQQAALTKGTQGATGISTQDLKDAGRTAVVLSAVAATSIITETVLTLSQHRAGATTTVTSYTVPAGKTFRLQSVQFGVRFTTNSTTVTFANARFNLRLGALVTSPLIFGDSKMAASNVATPNSDLPVPDGLEFAAGTVLSLWQTASATTLSLDAVIVGYEY